MIFLAIQAFIIIFALKLLMHLQYNCARCRQWKTGNLGGETCKEAFHTHVNADSRKFNERNVEDEFKCVDLTFNRTKSRILQQCRLNIASLSRRGSTWRLYNDRWRFVKGTRNTLCSPMQPKALLADAKQHYLKPANGRAAYIWK